MGSKPLPSVVEGGARGSSHAERGRLIIVTHNPLMIGSMRRNQVRILVQEDSRPASSE